MKLSRILVEPSALLNIMNIKTLAYLKVDTKRLNSNKMTLYRFNKKGEKALISITLPLKVEGLRTKDKLFIIDLKTYFNVIEWFPLLFINASSINEMEFSKYFLEILSHSLSIKLGLMRMLPTMHLRKIISYKKEIQKIERKF